MKSDILSATDLAILPQIAVVLFVTVFLVALYRVLRPSAKEYYAEIAKIAIEEDVVAPPPPTQIDGDLAHGRS